MENEVPKQTENNNASGIEKETDGATTSPLEAPKKPLKPLLAILLVLVVGIGVLGFFIIKNTFFPGTKPTEVKTGIDKEEILPQVDSSVSVELSWSKTKENTVVLVVQGLKERYVSIGYELQYESEGIGKGVTSGSKPIDVTGEDSFEREIYLGTCSKNVCKPDLGVKSVSLVLEFTATDGKKSQFSKDYPL